MAESDLFALLEIMLRTFAHVPKVKPGGHSEEMFLELTDEEREEMECNICYQILKDVRQCENKHKFCYSCIFVWSTSGSPVNHSRCPVCRVQGLYVRNQELDDKIGNKNVKCDKRTCRWKGALKDLESHQHTTYPELISASSRNITAKTPELPALNTSGTPGGPRPQSQNRLRASAQSQTSLTSGSQGTAPGVRNTTTSQRQPLGNSSLNNTNNNNNSTSNPPTSRSSTSNQRTNGTQNSTPSTRARTRSRNRNASPQRRLNNTATGLPNGRLTSRARIRNGGNESNVRPAANQVTSGGNDNSNSTEQTSTETIHTPHPPTSGRPAPPMIRRLPTLPGLVSVNSATRPSESQTESSIDSNNNVSQTTPRSEQTLDSPRRYPAHEMYARRPGQQRSFGMIRERLMESRQRLDTLMTAFSSELDRGRQDLTDFQTERELRRQEQMAEIRDLGRRLSHVATELRGLLSQRRVIQSQIDNLADAAADDP